MEKEKYFDIYNNYKRLCIIKISEISSYDNWNDKFCRDEIKILYKKLIDSFKGIDFTQFTFNELKHFDFNIWDDDTILMPVWALDCLEDGTNLTTISGTEITFNKKNCLDKDTRFGCTAYGFNRSQLRDSKLYSILEK
jgi:hypothetical protein